MSSVLDLPSEQHAAVSAHGLVKHYRRRTALNELTCQVPEESFYVLIGENGAGKTTLLKALLGLERVESGSMDVLGMDPRFESHLVRAQTGYVPERSEVPYRQMSVREILEYHAGYYDTWESDYADELLDALRVDPDVRLKELSKGEARRIQVVMALAHRPPLLMLDEPTDAFDPISREQFYAILARHIATTPTTVIMSTHHVHEAERLATHVGVLRRGRLTAQVSCEEMQRFLRSYRAEVPDTWRGAPALERSTIRREIGSREIRWTIWGDEASIIGQLDRVGANVRDVTPVSVQDAALALLAAPDEEGPWVNR
jgi:ABC-2 type transport system ATP-binding protein